MQTKVFCLKFSVHAVNFAKYVSNKRKHMLCARHVHCLWYLSCTVYFVDCSFQTGKITSKHPTVKEFSQLLPHVTTIAFYTVLIFYVFEPSQHLPTTRTGYFFCFFERSKNNQGGSRLLAALAHNASEWRMHRRTNTYRIFFSAVLESQL